MTKKILLTNDDGIRADGLGVLASRLADLGEVHVVAPDRERSATSHAFTLNEPLRVVQEAPRWYAVSGTPADCVKLAVSELLQEPPDVVISGINSGPNLGSDILYSGTVAAAMEAAFMDLPSIAVSARKGEPAVYLTAARFISRFLTTFKQAPRSKRGLININIPAVPEAEIKGVKLCQLGVRLYNDTFEKRSDPNGRDYYWLSGQAIEDTEAEDSDVFAVNSGYIAVTPVLFNMTDLDLMNRLDESKQLSTLLK